MNAISKATRIIAKILEVAHWVGVALMVVILGFCAFAPDKTASMFVGGIEGASGPDTMYGFSFELVDATGMLNIPAVIVFAIAGIILFTLMAMVFRNVYLIIKTSEGNTWFSKGATPFQPEVTRMLREIGYFTIAVPMVGLIMSVIGTLVVGPEFAESSVDVSYVFFGLLVLWLTQVFTRGEELQEEAEGLI